jgi:FAD synthetase
MAKKESWVMAFGTFDILHPGHLFYLAKARKLGSRLIVVVSTDRNSKRIKGKKPLNSETVRAEKIKGLRVVDRAVVGKEDDLMEIVRKTRPDFIALGYDHKAGWLKNALMKAGLAAKVRRIPPFEEKHHKSSLIRERIAG